MERSRGSPAGAFAPAGTQKIYHTLLSLFTHWRGHYTRTMRTKILASIVLAVVVAASSPSALRAVAQRGHTEQSTVIPAFTDPATPAIGLTATDFVVREDGLNREIIRVATAPPPSHILLLIDDSQAADRSIPFLRTARTGFLKDMTSLTPAPQVAVMTFGERPTMRADFQPKPDAALTAASKFFATPGTGSYLLQALMDASKNLT